MKPMKPKLDLPLLLRVARSDLDQAVEERTAIAREHALLACGLLHRAAISVSQERYEEAAKLTGNAATLARLANAMLVEALERRAGGRAVLAAIDPSAPLP